MDIDLNLEEVVKKIVEQAEQIAIEAVIKAGEIAQKDIEVYAKRYMGIYYGEYKPIRYIRTKQLVNSIMPYQAATVKRGSGVNMTVGIVYDSSRLDYTTYVTRDGRVKHRDRPDSGWVLNNFLHGIHPRWPLDNEIGQDQLELMEKAVEKEGHLVAKFIADAFTAGVASRILKN